jgi:hypothetical protein
MAKSGFAIGLVILFSLLPVAPAVTAPGELSWYPESIPVEGGAGGWQLAGGSDIEQLAVTADDTLYAAVSGLVYSLYKSIDGGCSWSPVASITHSIVDIALTDDARVIHYATAQDVYRSFDGGISFQKLVSNPAVAGSDNIEITDIDVAVWGDSYIVAAATRDTDNGQYGGVYILDGGSPSPQWLDTGIGSFDAYAVAFSPGFASDRQLVALVTDESDSFVTTTIGYAGWGETIGNARLERDNSGAPVVVTTSAAITFPDDYSPLLTAGRYVQFVALDTGSGNGDVYAIFGRQAPANSAAVDLNIGSGYGLDNIDVTGLDVCGNATAAVLLAGAAGDGQVYRSYNSGVSWTRSMKQPTGQARTLVVMAPDFIGQNIAYAATSGAASALSVTRDGGLSWNQLGLIDTRIDSIVDLAVSPAYDQDNTIFVLTWGGDYSLWRSLNGGLQWQRVFSSTLDGVSGIKLAELSPKYGGGSRVVFLAGSDTGDAAIWKSDDNGQSFVARSAPISVKRWVVVDDTTLFIAGYDGSHGVVYRTSNSGQSYSPGAVAGNQSPNSIAVSPSYYQDGTVLVGNSNGWVFHSANYGSSFAPLPTAITSPPLSGSISVAFDPGFSVNNTVYAASDSPSGGIYRFVKNAGTGWQAIDSTLPPGGMLSELGVSADGVLYAANFQQVDTASGKGGIERCLEPAAAAFETVTLGLDDGATMFGLWLCGTRIWSIDTTNIRLMSFIDSLACPVTLGLPHDQETGVGMVVDDAVNSVSLSWQPLNGATGYQWQLDDDGDFASLPAGFKGNTSTSSVSLPALEPDTRYYWRVRACQPLLSPWSQVWSFTTSAIPSMAAPVLESPEDGAVAVPLRPLFRWSEVEEADGYELLVSSDPDFDNPEIAKIGDYALSGNSWRSDVSLLYDTAYFWKVRAVSSVVNSPWSTVSTFTTEAELAAEAGSTLEPGLNPGAATTIQPDSTLEPATLVNPQPPPDITTAAPAVTPAEATELAASPQPPPRLLSQGQATSNDWLYFVITGVGAVVVLAVAIGVVVKWRNIS